MRVNLIIDTAAGGALKIFAGYIQKSLSQDSTTAKVSLVDYRDATLAAADVVHFAAWYLYRDAAVQPPPEKTLVTIHHLLQWNETIQELVDRPITLIAMSSEWYRYLVSRAIPDRVCLVPYGVDLAAWQLSNRSWAGANKKLNIGVVGRVYADGRKGERLFPPLCARLPRHRFRFTIIGPGWEPTVAKLKSQDVEVDLVESLSMDALRQAYAMFDVFLCTSDIEGGPLPLLEAMAAGVTPVSTPVGLARDLLAGSGLGYLFPKGNSRAAATVLRRLADGRFPFVSPHTLRNAVSSLDWRSTAAGYASIYSAIHRGSCLAPDPVQFLATLHTARHQQRLSWRERIALWANPLPTDRWTQPVASRASNKLSRLLRMS